jgi:hypothetical protein
MRPTIAELRRLLIYDPETGLFKWRDPSARQPRGWFKGTKGVRNYRRIFFTDHHVLTSVVAWALMTGKWPRRVIDYRDRDHANNRWKNLRECTKGQSDMNRSRNKNNTTGVHGVSRFMTEAGKLRYRASIRAHKKYYSLGVFDSVAAATTARQAAEKEHFGEFRPL